MKGLATLLAASGMLSAVSCVTPESADGPAPKPGGADASGAGGAMVPGTGAGGSGSSMGGTGGAAGPPAADVQPLSASTFIFQRNETIPGRGWQGSLLSYDLEKRSERLLFVHPHGTINGATLSSDRKWVLYAGTHEKDSKVVDQIWRRQVDGSRLEKVHDPALYRQDMGVIFSIRTPLWSKDQKSVLFHGIALPGARSGFHWIERVQDGKSTQTTTQCDVSGVMDLSPAGDTILVYHGARDCQGVPSGLAEWTIDPLAPKRSLVPSAEVGVNELAVWLRNGSGVIFQGENGLVKLDFASNEKQPIFTPPEDAQFHSLTTGPNGEVVLGLTGDKEDIHLLDPNTGRTTALTTTGNNRYPHF
jgi:hypothetical protein